MIEQNQVNQLVELQVIGGGYLTEVQPLVERGFYRQKLLVPPDVPENYMEVTEKFKTDWEAADHSEPPQSFIDLWNYACGKWGRYNESTRLFELNGLTDITYNEAIAIWRHTAFSSSYFPSYCRTNIPHRYVAAYGFAPRVWFSNIEVLNILPYNESNSNLQIPQNDTFDWYDVKIERVIGVMKATDKIYTVHARSLPTLVEIKISGISKNFYNLANAPKVNLDSWIFLVANSANTTDITITVHANVYAKLTGDTTNSAAAVLTPEEIAQWSALLDTAVDRNIRFAAA